LFGESGGGKTWIALALALDVLHRHGRVLCLDHENGPHATIGRLLALGATPQQLGGSLTYITPHGPLDLTSMQALTALDHTFTLAIVDSVGEHLAADSTNPDKDDEVARSFQHLRRLLCDQLGAAVLLIDHIPKSTEADRHQAIGSQRKRAAVDAAFRVDTITPAAKGTTGRFRLTCAKDRHGNFTKATTVAEMTLTSHDDGTRTVARFEQPPAPVDHAARLRDAVTRALEGAPDGLGVRALRAEARAKAGSATDSAIDHAAGELVRTGVVEVVDQGHGRPKLHRLALGQVSTSTATPPIQEVLG
jgi:hypothetical protein